MRRGHPAPATEGNDAGMTLAEVVIAMAVFTVLAGSVLGILIQTTKTTGANLRRTTATNLAAAQIEQVRGLTFEAGKVDPLPEGRTTSTPTVGKITYKVVRTVTLANADATTTTCKLPDTTAISFKSVRVQVTWPGTSKGVITDTNLALGGYGATAVTGPVAVTLTGADGPLADFDVSMPVSGVTVVHGTNDDGCAVFSNLVKAQSYTASVSAAGYVGTANSQTASTSLTADSSLTKTSLTYAAARSLTVALDIPAGATQLPGIPLRIGNTYNPDAVLPICTAGSTSQCTTGLPGTVSNLYPATYNVTAGACNETSASTSSTAVTQAAGGTAPTATLPLGAINVKVQTIVGSTPIVGRPVTFTHDPQSTGNGCAAGETYSTTSVSGGSMLALPYGTWRVKTTSIVLGVPTVVTTTVTVNATTRTQPSVLLVVS